jgi:hypothetical protein
MTDTATEQVDRLAGETLISLAAAAAKLGTAGGERVFLEHVRVGTRLATTWPAVCRFVAATTHPGSPPPAPTRTPTQRRRADDRADEKLKRLGL